MLLIKARPQLRCSRCWWCRCAVSWRRPGRNWSGHRSGSRSLRPGCGRRRGTPPSRRPVRDLPSRRRGLRAFQSAQATIARQWLTERL